MQRLRDCNQLGVCENLYMNATHNRFEHSMGVSYLAGKMCKRLQTRQPQLEISEKDVLCVTIAGLYHDLGHGPFSHTFDGEFPKQLIAKGRLREEDKWNHEEISLRMIDAALRFLGLRINKNELDKPLEQIRDGIDTNFFGVYSVCDPYPMENVLTSLDFIFIKECILGKPLDGLCDFIGRERGKEFLYDIVNNVQSGLDVDKMDYFAHDRRKVMGSGEVDVILLEEAFVAKGACDDPNECVRCRNHSSCSKLPRGMHLMICYPNELITKAMDFFKNRFSLHTQVYTHKTAKAVEYMICDILLLAEDHIDLRNTYDGVLLAGEPRHCRISEAMKHPTAYLNLTDSIINIIASSPKEDLVPAQRLIDRLRARDLYKCISSERIKRSDKKYMGYERR
mmetsp:Transcript_34753/g.51017  ORF Transcript_34753/g.51017 Transcript_34753/m.51017 type:complete len:395 (+) Transcript_34753:198-1382(+)